jgi:hypothetical protein
VSGQYGREGERGGGAAPEGQAACEGYVSVLQRTRGAASGGEWRRAWVAVAGGVLSVRKRAPADGDAVAVRIPLRGAHMWGARDAPLALVLRLPARGRQLRLKCDDLAGLARWLAALLAAGVVEGAPPLWSGEQRTKRFEGPCCVGQTRIEGVPGLSLPA